MDALVYVDVEKIQGIHYYKSKVAQNEKWKQLVFGFSYSKNMASFLSILLGHFIKYSNVRLTKTALFQILEHCGID